MSTSKSKPRPHEVDLELVSEAILSLLIRDPERPHYADRILDRKIDLDRRREPFFASLSRFGEEVLLQSECEGLFELARLTARQELVFRKRLSGATFEEIGHQGGHTKQGAQRVFVQALKKITRAYRVYPYVGLSEVYRREVGRGLVRRPSGTMSR